MPSPIEDIAKRLRQAGLGMVTVRDLERAAIANALMRNDNNRTHAARELGLSTRTLHRKLKEAKANEDHVTTI